MELRPARGLDVERETRREMREGVLQGGAAMSGQLLGWKVVRRQEERAHGVRAVQHSPRGRNVAPRNGAARRVLVFRGHDHRTGNNSQRELILTREKVTWTL